VHLEINWINGFLTRGDVNQGLNTSSGICQMRLVRALVKTAHADLSRLKIDLYLLYSKYLVYIDSCGGQDDGLSVCLSYKR
jgi:hypothetical protein